MVCQRVLSTGNVVCFYVHVCRSNGSHYQYRSHAVPSGCSSYTDSIILSQHYAQNQPEPTLEKSVPAAVLLVSKVPRSREHSSNVEDTRAICAANSRVGARTRACASQGKATKVPVRAPCHWL